MICVAALKTLMQHDCEMDAWMFQRYVQLKEVFDDRLTE